jgi:hypothetical protein
MGRGTRENNRSRGGFWINLYFSVAISPTKINGPHHVYPVPLWSLVLKTDEWMSVSVVYFTLIFVINHWRTTKFGVCLHYAIFGIRHSRIKKVVREIGTTYGSLCEAWIWQEENEKHYNEATTIQILYGDISLKWIQVFVCSLLYFICPVLLVLPALDMTIMPKWTKWYTANQER